MEKSGASGVQQHAWVEDERGEGGIGNGCFGSGGS